MKEECLAAVKIDQDLCSRCKVCYSLCPFEAINEGPEDGKIRIDIQKCQVCGICYSACPVSAIEMAYYKLEDMLDQVLSVPENEKAVTYFRFEDTGNQVPPGHGEGRAETLVLMCRGNSPNDSEVMDILTDQGLSGQRYVVLRVPCAGRIPTSFIFNALHSGMKNVVSIQCQDGFCRMKEGTNIETRRMLLGMAVIEQFGYRQGTIKVVKYSRKAVWMSKECVGCDKCVFICPYGAIKAEPFSSPTIDAKKCVGCGACQMVCPHHAIQVKGFEFDRVLSSYQGAAKVLRMTGRRPTILIFSCQWSEFSALDHPDELLKGKNALMLEIPCFKSMDPVHVVNALRQGFDGVMAVVCSAKDCKLQDGRDAAERQLEVLYRYLKKLDLLDRFEMHELSPRCEGEFNDKLEAFHKRIASLPSVTADVKKGAE